MLPSSPYHGSSSNSEPGITRSAGVHPAPETTDCQWDRNRVLLCVSYEARHLFPVPVPEAQARQLARLPNADRPFDRSAAMV